jgi:hypothetical protein
LSSNSEKQSEIDFAQTVRVVGRPFGKRPFRVHVDPSQDGAEVVNMVLDRVRAELLRGIGLGDLLTPRVLATKSQNAA